MTAQTDETKLAVLTTNFSNLSQKFDRALSILETLPNIYLTQKEHVEFVNAVKDQFTAVNKQIESDKRDRAISTWVERTSIGAAVSIITFLLMFYIQHGGSK